MRTTEGLVFPRTYGRVDGPVPPQGLGKMLEAEGIWDMGEYVRRRQATIAEYIADQTIYKLCTGEDRMEVSIRLLRWWDQYHGPTQSER